MRIGNPPMVGQLNRPAARAVRFGNNQPTPEQVEHQVTQTLKQNGVQDVETFIFSPKGFGVIIPGVNPPPARQDTMVHVWTKDLASAKKPTEILKANPLANMTDASTKAPNAHVQQIMDELEQFLKQKGFAPIVNYVDDSNLKRIQITDSKMPANGQPYGYDIGAALQTMPRITDKTQDAWYPQFLYKGQEVLVAAVGMNNTGVFKVPGYTITVSPKYN